MPPLEDVLIAEVVILGLLLDEAQRRVVVLREAERVSVQGEGVRISSLRLNCVRVAVQGNGRRVLEGKRPRAGGRVLTRSRRVRSTASVGWKLAWLRESAVSVSASFARWSR